MRTRLPQNPILCLKDSGIDKGADTRHKESGTGKTESGVKYSLWEPVETIGVGQTPETHKGS